MTKKKKKIISFLLFISLTLISSVGIGIYKVFFQNNIVLPYNETETYIYIKTGSSYQDVIRTLDTLNIIKNFTTFKILARIKKYNQHIKPGKYLIKSNMNNNQLIDMLRMGKQVPVKLIFNNNIRTKKELIDIVTKKLEVDSLSLYQTFENNSLYEPWGFNSHNILCMFIPNTYEFYWNTNSVSFFERMYKEYKKFWNIQRLEKAKKANLSPIEITILASIVLQETKKIDEMPKIAGVYINRLKKDMPLQADPTVVYAIGDFSIKRVLKKHLEIDSPYNTYKYKGLPPGPICLPDPVTIDKTLDYEQHNYLFFCAKEDFSGYHNFAETIAQHQQNALKYKIALNKKNIK